jgi:flagellin
MDIEHISIREPDRSKEQGGSEMAISINSNIAASRAAKNMGQVDRNSSDRRARLSSGLAVNSGRESGARLSVSEGMRAEIGGLVQGTRNAEHALDLLRTAEGGMNEVSAMLIRMRELAIGSSTETLNDNNRESMDAEFNQLKEEIDQIVRGANYNDQTVLSGFGNEVIKSDSTALTDAAATGVRFVKLTAASEGTYSFIDNPIDNEITLGNGTVTQTINLGSRTVDGQVATGTTQVANFDRLGIEVTLAGSGVKGASGSYTDGELNGKIIEVQNVGGSFQLGSDAQPADRLEYDIADLNTDGHIIDLAHASIGTRDTARGVIARIDGAIDRVSKVRGEVGAIMNRLTHTLDFTANSIERINASESTVRDVDYAWETSHLARNEIVRQASMSTFLKAQVPVDMVMGLLQSPL